LSPSTYSSWMRKKEHKYLIPYRYFIVLRTRVYSQEHLKATLNPCFPNQYRIHGCNYSNGTKNAWYAC
jgi:hypothetical protein